MSEISKTAWHKQGANNGSKLPASRYKKQREKFTVELNATVVKEVVNKFIPQLQLQDCRQLGKVKFSGHCLIFTLVLAKMCGHHTACAIGRFWAENQSLLKRALPSFPDIPVSHDTIKRTIENLVFENLGSFIEGFALHVLFETLSDLHVSANLPDELVPFYKEVLLEYNQMKKDQEAFRAKYHTQGTNLYKATIFNSTFKGAQMREQDLLAINQNVPLLTALRTLRLSGCCAKTRFVPKKYALEFQAFSALTMAPSPAPATKEQHHQAAKSMHANPASPKEHSEVKVIHKTGSDTSSKQQTIIKSKFQVNPFLEAIALGRHIKNTNNSNS